MEAMLDSEKARFAAGVAHVSICYPNAPDSKLRPAAYWEELKRFDIAAVLSAIELAKKQSRDFFPTAPQIRALAEVEQKAIDVARASEHKMLPAPYDRQRELILQDFYHACDRTNVTDKGKTA